MMVFSTLIEAVAQLLHMIISIYIWVIIIAALISWVRPDPYNPIIQTLYRLTEPAYALVRKYIPTAIGGIDLAPIIIILGLQFFDLFIVKILFQMASNI